MIPEKFKSVKISDFDYLLSEQVIAQYPLEKRDESKLLVYNEENISHRIFNELPGLLPENTQLIINNARVIPARLNFYKSTGAKIEIFLLEPENPSNIMEIALRAQNTCIWQCMVGNLKRWKDNETLTLMLNAGGLEIRLNAMLNSRKNQWVELTWNAPLPFSTILDLAGKIPLPPYIKRDAGESDKDSYQTVFAKMEGAVAAPTAGLHFSDDVLLRLNKKQINTTEVTLFVGAGTFAPVMVDAMVDHEMHAEIISVTKQSIDKLLQKKIRVAVGTTSLRTLESLYWIGVKINEGEKDPLFIEKSYPYQIAHNSLSWTHSLQIVSDYMSGKKLELLMAKTALMIMPGYTFRSVNGLITNFHHPKTTLIMLVAAFIGDDWRKVYNMAIENNYRFLSYGDSSLLWKQN